MAEIVKMLDRKSTFIKTKVLWSFVVLAVFSCINPSASSSSGSSLIGGTNPTSIFSNPSTFSLNREDNNNKYKFSSILLEKKPFETTEVSKPESTIFARFPDQIETNGFIRTTEPPPSSVIQPTSVIDTAEPSFKLPGSSLWTIISKSFLKPKDEFADAAKNSVFATPQLKTPRQAWEDLVANAKTGFRGNYEPFKYTTTTTSTTTPVSVPQTQQPNITANPEDTSRSPRDSPWHVDTPTLAWDTMKVMLGVNKDLFSHLWNKNVQKNYHTYSPIKNALVRPFEEYVRFKQGIASIHTDKLSDVLSLGLLHKDRKVSAFKSLLDPIGTGWSKPAVGVTHHHHLITDASLIGRWIKAKINLKKHLLLTKWRLTAELLKGIPAIFKVKLFLIKTILNLIANKHESLIFPLIKILHNSIWLGKKNFLRAVLFKKPVYIIEKPVYGVEKPLYGVEKPLYGVEKAVYGLEKPAYGVEASYPGTNLGYQVDLTNKNIQQIRPPPQPSQQILPIADHQPLPIVTKYPLYSYPALPSDLSHNVENYKYGAPSPVVTDSRYNGQGKLIDLPFTSQNAPVQYNYKAPSNQYDSVISGSEESPQHQSLFLSKLVKSFEKPTTAERTEQIQQTQPPTDDGTPKFSLKLLNSRFASR